MENFELVFWGGTTIRYRRFHYSSEEARLEALRIMVKMENRAAHPAIITGPGLGPDGMTVT